MTVAGPTAFTYDLAGRMKSVVESSETTRYTYDGLGKRTKASWGDVAAEKTRFFWDPNGALANLALERDGAGSLRRRYAYGTDLLSVAGGSSTSYYQRFAR